MDATSVQLSDVATSGEANMLHFDGTTKEGHKYGSFQLTTDDGQYALAVAETLSGSADHTARVLCRILFQKLYEW